MPQRHKELLELLDKSGASLYTLLTRLTLREEIAEELMQELFIKLSNSRGFRKSASRDAYARRAAINLAFDWRRKYRQKPPFPAEAGSLDGQASNESSPLSKLIRTEELEEILDTIGQLKKAQRQVIVMRYVQEQSYDDIAGQMKKTPHHVRALCSKALNRLRDLLGANHQKTTEKEIHNVTER